MSEQVKELGASRASSDAAEDAAPMGRASLDGFTPGPWFIGPRDDTAIMAPDGDEPPWLVAQVLDDCGERDDEYKANARLIAASPEMLEALKAFSDNCVIDDVTHTVRTDEWVLSKVRAALRKAEGAS